MKLHPHVGTVTGEEFNQPTNHGEDAATNENRTRRQALRVINVFQWKMLFPHKAQLQ